MTYTAKDFATDIKNRFPEHSPLHDDTNLGAILVDDCIGVELTSVESALFSNSDARFLSRATGTYLDRYGAWFGLPRTDGMSDADYRTQLTSFRGSDITVTGLKNAIATILGCSSSEISITNSYPNYCTVGGTIYANYFSGTACKLSGNYNVVSKTLTITIAPGSDPDDILSGLISNMIVPGVTATIVDPNLVIDNVATGTDALMDTTGFTTVNFGSFVSSDEEAYQGDYSLKVTTSGDSNSGVAADGLVTAYSTAYEVELWCLAPEGRTLILLLTDSGWNIVDTGAVAYEGTGEWQYMTVTATNPSTGGTIEKIIVDCSIDTDPTFDFYLDRITLAVA